MRMFAVPFTITGCFCSLIIAIYHLIDNCKWILPDTISLGEYRRRQLVAVRRQARIGSWGYCCRQQNDFFYTVLPGPSWASVCERRIHGLLRYFASPTIFSYVLTCLVPKRHKTDHTTKTGYVCLLFMKYLHGQSSHE